MPSPISFRLNEQDEKMMDDLKKELGKGSIKPLGNSDILRYAIQKLHESECANKR